MAEFLPLHFSADFSTVPPRGLAQLVEQLTLNQRVAGSNPAASNLPTRRRLGIAAAVLKKTKSIGA